MGTSKTEHFSETQNSLALLTKALGHPARIAIIEYLLRVNTCICGDIVDELPLAQATISQHLRALKEADLIQGNISGNAVCYCINPTTFKQLETMLSPLLKQSKLPKNKCC